MPCGWAAHELPTAEALGFCELVVHIANQRWIEPPTEHLEHRKNKLVLGWDGLRPWQINA
jgi:hypothetical protein